MAGPDEMTDVAGLPGSIATDLAERTGARVAAARRVSGGDIHSAWAVVLGDGTRLFVKSSDQTAAGLFAAEAEGLAWLGGFEAVAVPAVLAWRDRGDAGPGYLALEWIEPGHGGDPAAMGEAIGRLHANRLPAPGWHRGGFIGPLPQDNRPCDDWSTFWVERRLRPMLARTASHFSGRDQELFDAVCESTPELIGSVDQRGHRGHLGPLHGDLWGGNAMFDTAGRPIVYDPAVYAGDPEVDVAMMTLFGGFGDACLAGWHGVLPAREGWQRRRALYQLWPLLVHVALFGGGYSHQALAAARRVVG